MPRQLRAHHGELVARLEHTDQSLDVFERARRAELNVDPPQRLVVARRDAEQFPHALERVVLENSREDLGLAGFV